MGNISAFIVFSVVLVHVMDLVIEIYWFFHVLVYGEIDDTSTRGSSVCLALVDIIVPFCNLDNFGGLLKDN